MDWGDEALLDTIERLQEARHQARSAAGRNLAEARGPAILERNGVRVAFLAYCSVLREGYAAGPEQAGRRAAEGPHLLRARRIPGRACRRAS